jgi:tRNA1Val (adenine37-N6)-methyltransferase
VARNNYFQFRQFRVEQDHCAMKVCTDACLFGAFVARQIGSAKIPAGRILDIGAGTGLLSLMLAQKTAARITALEIDPAAYGQALDNFQRSPWSARVEVKHEDATGFHSSEPYDFIISNPPFFEGDLKSGDHVKDAAKHEQSLTLEQLVDTIGRNLSMHGNFAVLLPPRRLDYFLDLASRSGYFLREELLIRQKPAGSVFRAVLLFGPKPFEVVQHEMVMIDESGAYTAAFVDLLQDYYLNL